MDISWTKFDTLDACPLRFHLTYQKRIRMPVPVLRYAVGAVTHTAMEKWAESNFDFAYLRSALKQLFNDYVKSVTFVSKGQYETLLRKTAKAVLTTAQIYQYLGIPNHQHSIEPRFKVELRPGDFLIGGWDLLDLDTKSVYDIKTTDSVNRGKLGQLETYAVAAREQGIEVERVGFITPLLNSKIKTVPITAAAVDERKESLLKALEQMHAGVAPTPNVGPHCYGCDYNRTAHCPATYGAPVKAPARKKKPATPRGRKRR